MEITNEIKAKVVALYLGQPIAIHGKLNSGFVYGSTLDVIRKYGIDHNDTQLILKPFSQISDEDAIEVARMQFEIFRSVEAKVSRNLKEPIKVWFMRGSEILHSVDITEWNQSTITTDFLRNKGYDMPHGLLEGKTLHKAGLAIYEQ